MVNVQPKNAKLVDRARRIIAQAAGVSPRARRRTAGGSGQQRAHRDRDGQAGVDREEANDAWRIDEPVGRIAMKALHG